MGLKHMLASGFLLVPAIAWAQAPDPLKGDLARPGTPLQPPAVKMPGGPEHDR
ncbi:MAG TPA: hypothetical protein VGH23_09690 [Rhizomicrobium sp.]|jgi:hypothetical protein